MNTITSGSRILDLLTRIAPDQETATLRSPGQPAMPGRFFPPERRSVPFMADQRALKPRPGVPLEARIEGEAGAFRFFTQLFVFEGSGRMRLAMPATIEVQRLATAHVPPETFLQIDVGGSWVDAPLVALDSSGATFLYSALAMRLAPQGRVRGRLLVPGGALAPVHLEITGVQVAPGTGERLATTRFASAPSSVIRWLRSEEGRQAG